MLPSCSRQRARAGSAPAVGEGDFTPYAVRIDPGRGGSGGTGGEPDGGVDGGMAAGACDNPHDMDVIATTNLSAVTTSCAGLTCANLLLDPVRYEDCVSACVQQRVAALSAECTACYGAVSRCGLNSFCLGICQFNTCGLQCLNCLDFSGCLAEFEECRGILGDGCDGGGLPFIPATDNQ